MVTIIILDKTSQPVSGAEVVGIWSEAKIGSVSGVTGSNGAITFNTGNIKGDSSVTFTMDIVTHSSLSYNATANDDPDSDSNGTPIIVCSPPISCTSSYIIMHVVDLPH